jgi:15-cis-phytoene synthase
MAIHADMWVHPLLARAYEALHSPVAGHIVHAEQNTLKSAYEYCAHLTKANSHTFYLTSRLLSVDKRRAARALYAFCRVTDDLIDTAQQPADAYKSLNRWRSRLGDFSDTNDPVLLAWADTQARYRIPRGYAAQLIDGISRDLIQNRYSSFAELAEYCYGVASTVGLMVMHIIDFQGEVALPYAVKLGVALQLTNILRDVGEDWRMGRLYLPLDEMAKFGLSENDVEQGIVDDRWRAFMRFQITRTRELFREAEPGISFLGAEGRFAITAAARLYRAILDDIESHDYDVFSRRAHVGLVGKIRRLPGIWWQTRMLSAPC